MPWSLFEKSLAEFLRTFAYASSFAVQIAVAPAKRIFDCRFINDLLKSNFTVCPTGRIQNLAEKPVTFHLHSTTGRIQNLAVLPVTFHLHFTCMHPTGCIHKTPIPPLEFRIRGGHPISALKAFMRRNL